ncbi:MAG: anthrone oxygenase family protein [Pseudomonadota bacterium]
MSSLLTLVAVLGTGLMAGVYFAFSVFIMPALAELTPPTAAAAMNAINRVILKTIFIPIFFISSLNVLILGIIAPSWFTLSSAALYLLGMTVCTAAFNVPLNNNLRDAAARDLEQIWSHYLVVWTRWNHVRTISSVLACALLATSLVV